MLVRIAVVVLLMQGLLVAGCGDLVDEEEGAVDSNEIPILRRGVIPISQGYLDGKAVEYYQLGHFVPRETSWFPSYDQFPGLPVREMYVWADGDGEPDLTGAQRPIIDSLPRQAQSSDFFELVFWHPEGVQGNQIKSRATLLRSGLRLERTGRVVNCPLVGPAAGLAGAPGQRFRKLELWYRGQTTHCFLLDGGTDSPAPRVFTTVIEAGRSELRVAAGDVYTLRSTAFVAADEVRAIPVPRNDIFRRAPGHPEYTPLLKVWDVAVPSDYQVGQLRSYADLFPVPGFTDPRVVARAPETFCNCPLVSQAN